jgi:hypothetical protein
MIRMMTRALALTMLVASVAQAISMPTSFTYQGQLKFQGVPANGVADLSFRLWDAEEGGVLAGSVGPISVDVTNGLFEVDLDFGDGIFDGLAYWIEVEVEFPSGAGNWTVLSPRQSITPAPYALFAATADGLALPYSGHANSTATPFAITQTGAGRAAAIGTNNTSSEQPTLVVLQWGLASAGQFWTNNSSNEEPALFASSGSPGAGLFAKNVGSGPAVEGSALGNGRAASFVTESATNSSPTVYAEQKGAGRCGHFRITNATNDYASVSASTTGEGAAVSAYTVGGGPAVHAKTTGTGYALHADSTDDVEPEGGGVVLIGQEDGNNVAIDGNEIMARSNGETSTLYLNVDGGDVVFGGAIDIGFEVVHHYADNTDYTAVYCPAGKKALGGGCQCFTYTNTVEASMPTDDADGWFCRCHYSQSISVRAICANVQ